MSYSLRFKRNSINEYICNVKLGDSCNLNLKRDAPRNWNELSFINIPPIIKFCFCTLPLQQKAKSHQLFPVVEVF